MLPFQMCKLSMPEALMHLYTIREAAAQFTGWMVPLLFGTENGALVNFKSNFTFFGLGTKQFLTFQMF